NSQVIVLHHAKIINVFVSYLLEEYFTLVSNPDSGRDLWSITYGELAVDFRQLLRSYYIVFKVATRNAVKVTYLYVYDFESNMVYIDHETGTTYVTRNLLVRRLLSVYNNGQILSSKVDFF